MLLLGIERIFEQCKQHNYNRKKPTARLFSNFLNTFFDTESTVHGKLRFSSKNNMKTNI